MEIFKMVVGFLIAVAWPLILGLLAIYLKWEYKKFKRGINDRNKLRS